MCVWILVKFGKDPRQYSTTTKEFVDDGKGNIKGVNTVQVEWTQSPTGQWSMKEMPGSEKYYPADLILLAMGFLGPEKTVPTELGLELDNRGNVKAVKGQYGTSREGIFAAGGLYKRHNYTMTNQILLILNQIWNVHSDCRRGQSLVVWAITEGRQAARQVDTYLSGSPSKLPGPGGVIDWSAAA